MCVVLLTGADVCVLLCLPELTFIINKRVFFQIHHLDLSSNKIQRGDEILALAVHKIDRLVLRWCDLILNRYEEFVEALKRRETPVCRRK